MVNLKFVGKDPESNNGRSPTVFVDADNADLVIQGWTADAETLAACQKIDIIPDHESVVRIPSRLIELLRKACDDVERVRHQ
ncbi:hypothetical protein AB0I72_15840 [Nocardiopsis sp. NPDC049922]|uniref:hypothetical protein n=1 Tax=Nocardiopsis sp. NPDC049922 TaxID=3155157 RepID=UPI0033C19E37